MREDRGRAWHLCLLGGFRAAYRGSPVRLPPRVQRLVSALLLEVRPVRREVLGDRLFPDVPPHRSRQDVSHLAWLARRATPSLPIEGDRDTLWLERGNRWLDVEAFRDLAASRTLADRSEALELYAGDLLPDADDLWLVVEREALRLRFRSLTQEVAAERLAAGDSDGGVTLLSRLFEQEPLDEDVLRRLLEALIAASRRGAAAHVYARFLVEADGAGLQPEPRTQALASTLPRGLVLAGEREPRDRL